MQKIIITTLLLIVVTSFVSGCSWLPNVHKIDVQQGNIIEQEQVNKLRPGLSKDQAKFILGTPMLSDSFHPDRWDYIYRLKPGYGEEVNQRLTLFFENDQLTQIISNYQPGAAPETQARGSEVVLVPPGERVEKKDHWVNRMLNYFGYGVEEDEAGNKNIE